MTSGEASVTYSLSSRLFATAKASYTRGTKDTAPGLGLTSVNISEIPPLRGSMSVRYDRVTFFGEAELVATARQAHVDADVLEDPTPGYSVLNVRVGRQIQRFRVTINVDNVLDRTYLDFTSYRRDPFRSTVRVYEPGRNLYLNVSYRY
jgi:iron complex outermembrane receptor protein